MRLGRLLTRLGPLGLALGLLGVLQPPPARGQTVERSFLALRYDLDRPDANPFFCVSPGSNGALGDAWARGLGRIKTVGSSTTVTEFTSGELPFRDFGVGDVIQVLVGAPGPTTVTTRQITAKASGASITVDAAVDLSASGGFAFLYRRNVCGQTAADGWFSVGNWVDFTIVIQFQQGDLGGGLDWYVECRDGGFDASPTQVYPATGVQNIATAGLTSASSDALAGFERWSDCRVAILANTSDVSDAAANVEKIRVVAIGTKRN